MALLFASVIFLLYLCTRKGLKQSLPLWLKTTFRWNRQRKKR